MIFQWKPWLTLLLIWSMVFTICLGWERGLSAPNPEDTYAWQLPAWVPKPIVPINNPMTSAKVELGRYLFYEKRLSIDGKFACATCHIQSLAFTEKKTVSVGATGERHPRNSMGLANVAYNSILTWAHPGMKKLESQTLVPMFGERPIEMGLGGKEQEILQLFRSDPQYRRLFASAFDREKRQVTIVNITKSIASFERSLVSFNSPFDRYHYGGDRNAISISAKRGEVLFNSDRLGCIHCHSGLNFSDSIKHEGLKSEQVVFHNTGLYHLNSQGGYPSDNTGIYGITKKPADMGKFKVPTLRNIALTAPYMHDGSISTLDRVIDHYAAGGRTILTGRYQGVGSKNPLKSKFVTGFKITDAERQDLLAFLHSLTDESFVKNPAFGDPFSSRVKQKG